MKKSENLKLALNKKLELTKVIGRIHAGREKNLKKAKNLRKEIAQILTKERQTK